jgi:hypothetical protein
MLKKLMAAVLILSGLAVAGGCGKAPDQIPDTQTNAPEWTGWGPEEKGMRCRITCDKNVYAPADPIMAVCWAANLSQEAIVLGGVRGGYINAMSLSFSVDFILTDSRNQKVSGENRPIEYDQLKTRTINPGQKAEVASVDLRRWYKELPAGAYTLQAVCLRRHMEAASENIQWVSNELRIIIRD